MKTFFISEKSFCIKVSRRKTNQNFKHLKPYVIVLKIKKKKLKLPVNVVPVPPVVPTLTVYE